MLTRYLCASLSLLIATSASTQVKAPTADSLNAISTRGRLLAEYDQAAWHATDGVLAQRPAAGSIQGYVGLKQAGRWIVAFGRLSADSNSFLIAYEARQSVTKPDSFTVTRLEPARVDTSEFLRPARALYTARADFGTPGRRYNAAVLPAREGGWHVYLMPAQTQARIFPLGGDVRYTIAADGRSIVVKRQLHNSIIEFGGAFREGAAPAAGIHSAVLDNVPEDTDVFHVLSRAPKVPEYVVTSVFAYRVDLSGEIHLLGRREELVGPDGSFRPPKP